MQAYHRTLDSMHRARPAKLRVFAAPASIDMDAWERGRDVQLARLELEQATADYAKACHDLGEANRRLGKNPRNAYFSMRQRIGWRADAFRAFNRARSRIAKAKRQLSALGAL